MELIIHRINKINDLINIPKTFGTEIDIRTKGSKLILNHEPNEKGDKFEDYLEKYDNKTLVLNLKESGIEKEVLKLIRLYKIKSYFLLDVEMPYLYSASKKNEKNIAVRFSEYESIQLAEFFVNKVDWIWIDTVTKLPLNNSNINTIKQFKSCLVCPERWGRKKDINNYKKKMKKLKFTPSAIMTDLISAKIWQKN